MKDKHSIRKEIAALINSIKEHSDNIGTSEHIPQLELELILHKIEKLYQKSIIYNHLNSVPDTSSSGEPSRRDAPPATEKDSSRTIEKPRTTPPADLFGESVEKPVKKTEKKADVKPETKVSVTPPPATDPPVTKPRITDIRSAIGINDKFRFCNELFAGNMQEYEVAIQQLNASEDLYSAQAYFSNLQSLYNWNSDSECTIRLYELVQQRYS